VLGGEALDMLNAINTGHHGSLTTIHANSPRDALDKLITLALMAGGNYTTEGITRMVARTIELVVQLDFDSLANRRRVVSVFEVTGIEGAIITGNELWTIDPDTDRLAWTGIQPRCLAKFRKQGLRFDLGPRP